jgi:hypothetical protein
MPGFIHNAYQPTFAGYTMSRLLPEYWRRASDRKSLEESLAQQRRGATLDDNRDADIRRGSYNRLMLILLVGGAAIAAAYLINRVYCGARDASHKWEQRLNCDEEQNVYTQEPLPRQKEGE